MQNVKLEFCFYGTVLVNAEAVKSPIYMTKMVAMPFAPMVGLRIQLVETKTIALTAGWGNGPVSFVCWNEEHPEIMTACFESTSKETLDYLETRWMINEMRTVGWECREEGD